MRIWYPWPKELAAHFIALIPRRFLMASVGLYEGSRIAIRAAKDLVVGKHHVDAEEQEVNSVL